MPLMTLSVISTYFGGAKTETFTVSAVWQISRIRESARQIKDRSSSCNKLGFRGSGGALITSLAGWGVGGSDRWASSGSSSYRSIVGFLTLGWGTHNGSVDCAPLCLGI